MKIQAMKNYIPRKLLGRAILIFLFPIIFIELVVFIGFIQRHFAQVTNQMSESLTYEIKYIQSKLPILNNNLNYLAEVKKLGKNFGLEVEISDVQPRLKIINLEIFDFTGRAFVKKMRTNFGDETYFNFSERRKIKMSIVLNDKFLSIGFPRGRISAANPHQLLVLMVFVSILLVTLSLIILKNQIKPIIKLAEVSDAFGRGQSLPFKPAGSDEVRRAGIAFLAMRSRIERQIEQRAQMLSGVSHDLRTPLTRLKLSLSLSQDKKEREKMRHDVDSMQTMLDELLTFAKTDHLEELQYTNPVELLASMIKENEIPNKTIDFKLGEVAKDKTRILIRKSSFKRAIQNLLHNALNYGNQVVIRLKIGKKFLTLLIEDNGPGIPIHLRKDAVKPFTRLDQSRNQNKHSGVGLGLSITLDTVRNHGGSLSLEQSKTLGGLKVKINIPI